MDINVHKKGCTPFNPCNTCQAVVWLKEELTPEELQRFLPILRGFIQKTGCVLVISNEILDLSIQDLKLTARATNCLSAEKICCVGQLIQKERAQMMDLPNLGPKAFSEIEDRLAEMNLLFGMQVPENWTPPQA